jgi:hypothetical protein
MNECNEKRNIILRMDDDTMETRLVVDSRNNTAYHATSVKEVPGVVSNNSSRIKTEHDIGRQQHCHNDAENEVNRLAEDAMNERPASTTSEGDEGDAVIHQTRSRKRSRLSPTNQPLFSPESQSEGLHSQTASSILRSRLPWLFSFTEAGSMPWMDNVVNDDETIG